MRPTVHDLKISPPFFLAVDKGIKPFEVRRDDRGYNVGDYLCLREYNPVDNKYTGRTISRRISYILKGEAWGIKDGFVCLGLRADGKI